MQHDMDMYAHHYIHSNVSVKAIATGLVRPDQGQNEQKSSNKQKY